MVCDGSAFTLLYMNVAETPPDLAPAQWLSAKSRLASVVSAGQKSSDASSVDIQRPTLGYCYPKIHCMVDVRQNDSEIRCVCIFHGVWEKRVRRDCQEHFHFGDPRESDGIPNGLERIEKWTEVECDGCYGVAPTSAAEVRTLSQSFIVVGGNLEATQQYHELVGHTISYVSFGGSLESCAFWIYTWLDGEAAHVRQTRRKRAALNKTAHGVWGRKQLEMLSNTHHRRQFSIIII